MNVENIARALLEYKILTLGIEFLFALVIGIPLFVWWMKFSASDKGRKILDIDKDKENPIKR